MQSENPNSQIPRTEWWSPEAERVGLGELGEGDPKVQTSIVSKLWDVTCSLVAKINNTVSYI